jgi:DNA-binding response OmpR family regulator
MAGELIMITDDDRNIRRLYESYLVSAGYNVIQATSGEEALKKLDEVVPDLILLDVQMQGMDGFMTIRAIRDQKGLLDTPVLFLTSAADPEVKVKGLESDADDYILKTTPKQEFIARIKAALKRTERFRKTGGSGSLSGHLSNMPLSDLLQSIGGANKTASITFDAMDAAIYVEKGMIIHARKGEFSGEAALSRIFYEEKGPFLVVFDQLPVNIPKNPLHLMNTLMNMAADVDEVKSHVKRLELDKRAANIDYHLAEYSDLIDFRDKSPIACVDLMLAMKGTLMDNLKRLVSAVKEKEIYLVRTQN